MKVSLNCNVYDAAISRIEIALNLAPKAYVSFSGGKDSTVMLYLVAEAARRLGLKIGILIVDLEAQYAETIKHIERVLKDVSDVSEVFWVCLPIALRNAVSVYEPKWLAWDPKKTHVREFPASSISVPLPEWGWFKEGMEFEEFVPAFGQWYANGELCVCFVGIRSDESLNRYRTIASTNKRRLKTLKWTTQVKGPLYNAYPIYDWRTKDVWTFHAKYPDCSHNKIYDLMYKAGISIHQMRLCQPYGDDQRKGLSLMHVLEPDTWAKVVARVSGANAGALYADERGNVMGNQRITLPSGHTWESYAKSLLASMPPASKEHYEAKIAVFLRWWEQRGYSTGIPDVADINDEASKIVPSWRRIAKMLLRNDYWAKGLSFSPTKSAEYEKYLKIIKERKKKWRQWM